MRLTFAKAKTPNFGTRAYTNKRNDFVKIPLLLAGGLDKQKLIEPGDTEILILGMGGCGKSLVADAMIYFLYDYWDEDAIPYANKMCLEHKPVEASRNPVSITDHINGIDVDMIFFSRHRYVYEFKRGIRDSIGEVKRKSQASITFLSSILCPYDFDKTGIRIEIRQKKMLANEWCHEWMIDIEDQKLQTPEMAKSIQEISKLFGETKIQKLQKRVNRRATKKP